MTRLDEAGVMPRFQGLDKIEQGPMGDDHIINFNYPGCDDGHLGDIARRISKQHATEGSPPTAP